MKFHMKAKGEYRKNLASVIQAMAQNQNMSDTYFQKVHTYFKENFLKFARSHNETHALSDDRVIDTATRQTRQCHLEDHVVAVDEDEVRPEMSDPAQPSPTQPNPARPKDPRFTITVTT